jgi:hypothetical protein
VILASFLAYRGGTKTVSNQWPFLVGAATALVLAPARASAQVGEDEDAAATADAGAIAEAGPAIEPRARMPEGWAAWPRACSFRHAVCVHAQPGTDGASLVAAVDAADRAWDVVTGALKLPAPDADLDGAHHVFLVDAVAGGEATYLSERDARAHYDRASAFTLVDRKTPRGCALDTRLARTIARAALYRAAPATDEGSARAEAAYLARLAVPCAAARVDGVDLFQQHPERTIVDTWPDADARVGVEYDAGASLFFWWLDDAFGTEPGAVVRGLWALAATKTPLGALTWRDEPDAFDVLRKTFAGAIGTGSTIDDLLGRFAVDRAFVGDASDGVRFVESRGLGAAGRVRTDWSVSWPEKARRFASPQGIAPTGAAYVVVDHAGARPGSRLRVEAEWEEHAKMRWFVVKIDASGKPIASLPIESLERGTTAQMTVVDLDATAKVLVVGAALGEPRQSFDPDEGVWEPHGWLLTLAPE